MDICLNKLLTNLDKYDNKEKAINSYNLLNLSYKLLNNTDNINAELIDLLYNTIIKKNLITNKNEYVFCWEIFPKNINGEFIPSICRLHNNERIINKSSVEAQKELQPIFEKVDKKINIPILISDMWKKANSIDTNCISDDVYNFAVYDYDWFNPDNYDIVKKRSLLIPFEKNGRYFLLGTGFTTSEEIRSEKVDSFVIITLIIFSIISIYEFFFIKNKINRTGMIIFFILTIFVIYFLYNNRRKAGSYSFELSENKDQYAVILGMASITFGISISLNNFNINKSKYYQYILLTFIIIMFILNIRSFEQSGKSLYFFYRIRNTMMYMTIYVISVTLLLILFKKNKV